MDPSPEKPAPPRLKYDDILAAIEALPINKRLLLIELLQDALTGETTEGLKVTARSRKELRRLTNAKDARVMDWIRGFAPGEVFYDIGANVGQLTIAAAAMHRDRIRIVAIEPSFANYESLARNLSLNGLLSCTIPLQVALLDRTGLLPLNYRSTGAGTSLHSVGVAIDHLGEPFVPAEVQMMPTYRLDDLVGALALPPPTRVKIDVDGYEGPVLRGAGGVLARGTITELEIEVYDRDGTGTQLRDVCALLSPHHYDLVDTFQHPAPEGQRSFVADHLFRRNA